VARYRAAHPERAKATTARWQAEHPDEYRAARERWRQANPEKVALHQRRKSLKRKYGITLEQYEALFEAQGGRCAICGSDKAHGVNDTLHVDHDHATGRIRGLLCFVCNRRLGWFESPEAPMFIAYLKGAN
jgi:hypothetical protein